MERYEVDRAGKRKIKQYAKNLRKNMTAEECYLKSWLRKSGEQKVYKQFSVGRCIVDLAIPHRNLLIEIDGLCHEERSEKDARRDGWLGSFGFQILRVTNEDVRNNHEHVMAAIQAHPTSEQNRQRFYMARRAANKRTFINRVEA